MDAGKLRSGVLTTFGKDGLGRGDTGAEGKSRIKTGETGEDGVKDIRRQDYFYPKEEERRSETEGKEVKMFK